MKDDDKGLTNRALPRRFSIARHPPHLTPLETLHSGADVLNPLLTPPYPSPIGERVLSPGAGPNPHNPVPGREPTLDLYDPRISSGRFQAFARWFPPPGICSSIVAILHASSKATTGTASVTSTRRRSKAATTPSP